MGVKIQTEQPPSAPNYNAANEANYWTLIISDLTGVDDDSERQGASSNMTIKWNIKE